MKLAAIADKTGLADDLYEVLLLIQQSTYPNQTSYWSFRHQDGEPTDDIEYCSMGAAAAVALNNPKPGPQPGMVFVDSLKDRQRKAAIVGAMFFAIPKEFRDGWQESPYYLLISRQQICVSYNDSLTKQEIESWIFDAWITELEREA